MSNITNKADLGKVAITVASAPWDANTKYEKLTQVFFEGDSYVSLKDNKNVNPSTDTTGTWAKSTAHGKSLYELLNEKGLYDGTEEEFIAEWDKRAEDVDKGLRSFYILNKEFKKTETIIKNTVDNANAAIHEAGEATNLAISAAANAEDATARANTAAANAEGIKTSLDNFIAQGGGATDAQVIKNTDDIATLDSNISELESIYAPNCPFIKELYINEVGVSVGLSRVNNVYASGTNYFIAFAGIPGTGFKGYTKVESSMENAKGILPIYETTDGTGSIRGYIIVDWDKLEGDVSPSAYVNNKAYNVEYSPSIKVFLTKANEIREVELLANSNKERLDNIDDYKSTIDYSKFGLSRGLISASDGSINSSFEGTEVTGYVKVKHGDEIIYSGNSSSSGWSALAGYSDNQGNGFVSLILGETTNIIERKVVVPSGVNYVRAGARNSQSAWYAGVDLLLKVSSQMGHPRFADYDSALRKPHKKILMIGNSYAIDASAYAPFIMSALGTDFDLTIGVVYYAGCDLSSHVDFISNDSAVYGFVKYSPSVGSWVNTSNQKFSDIAKDEDWDIVTLQQSSAATPDVDTYANHIDTLMNLCTSKIGHNVKYGWLMGQARNDVDGTTTQYFNKQVNIVNSKLLTYPINFVIPVSTAVQNARTTRLSNDVEDFASGIQGGHMREGLARQLSAYSFILAISEYLGYNVGIIGDTTRCDYSWTQGKGIFNQLGTNVGVSDSNVLLIQKCAELASTNKMEIKDCTIFQ